MTARSWILRIVRLSLQTAREGWAGWIESGGHSQAMVAESVVTDVRALDFPHGALSTF